MDDPIAGDQLKSIVERIERLEEEKRGLPKAQQLEIAEPLVERASFGAWSRLKAAQLTTRVLAALTGQEPALRKSAATAAAEWVHPLLRFDVGTPPSEPAVDQLEEAAA